MPALIYWILITRFFTVFRAIMGFQDLRTRTRLFAIFNAARFVAAEI